MVEVIDRRADCRTPLRRKERRKTVHRVQDRRSQLRGFADDAVGSRSRSTLLRPGAADRSASQARATRPAMPEEKLMNGQSKVSVTSQRGCQSRAAASAVVSPPRIEKPTWAPPEQAIFGKFQPSTDMMVDYLLLEFVMVARLKVGIRIESIEVTVTLCPDGATELATATLVHSPGTSARVGSQRFLLAMPLGPEWRVAMEAIDQETRYRPGVPGSIQVTRLVLGKPFAPETEVDLSDTTLWPKHPTRFQDITVLAKRLWGPAAHRR